MKRINILIFLAIYGELLAQDQNLVAQSMSEIYAIDFLAYEEKGNAPHTVAMYWTQIGNELIIRIQDGEKFDLEDPDHVLSELIEINGDPRDPKDVQMQILLALRETGLTDLEKDSAHYSRNAIDRAKKTFALIGPDLGKKLALEKLRKRLPRHFIDGDDERSALRRVLSNVVLSDAIGITSKQRAKIERFTKDAQQEFRIEAKEAIAQIRIATDKQWSDLLKRLNESQREEVRAIAGQPVDWYCEFDLPSYWNRRWARGEQLYYGTEVGADSDDDGIGLHEKSDKEIADLGILKADRFLVKLMNDPVVQSFLELDLEQREGWRILYERYLKKGILYYAEGRKKQLESTTDALYPAEFVSLLSESQLQDLRWLEYQARTGGSIFRVAGSLLPKELSEQMRHELRKSLPDEIRELYFRSVSFRKSSIRRGLKRGNLALTMHGIDMKPAYELCQIRDSIEESLADSLFGVLTADQIDLYRDLVFSNRQGRNGG